MMSIFASTVMHDRYAWPGETWRDVADRVATAVLGVVPVSRAIKREVAQLIFERKFMPGGRYLSNAGRDYHQVQNCLLLRAEDTREGWADLISRVMLSTMTGAGIGVVYSDLRGKGAPLKRTGGYSSGPIALMHAVNEAGRAARSGGSRRGAIWAGLHWNHPDVMDFIRLRDWSEDVKRLKAADFNYAAPMDHTNISVILDDEFFDCVHEPTLKGDRARDVYRAVVRRMCETGEPGFSVDVGANAGENLRNACTEITSHDDSDICNLGSVNLARIETLTEMRRVVELGTLFLLAGTVYSDVPYPKVARVREKNRRLGLGLMGVHEFLLRSGRKYGDRDTVAPYLDEYARSGVYASRWAREWGLSAPVKTRAIAPTGTIGIVAETTTGIEPIFCRAYRRRYFDHGVWRAQYVVDPTARALVEAGVNPARIEDAYSIDADTRVGFQEYAQLFVDHGISSTVNLPAWGSERNSEDTVSDFEMMLLRRLPGLRGTTVYPDGARGGQPLTPCSWGEALAHEGEILTEQVDVCDLRGGSCGA